MVDIRMELRIFEGLLKGDVRVVAGLDALVPALLAVYPTLMAYRWEVLPGAWGYGDWVCALEDRLPTTGTTFVNSSEVIGALEAGESFYNVRLRITELGLEFGLIDSAFLYVRAEKHLLESVAGHFQSIEYYPLPAR